MDRGDPIQGVIAYPRDHPIPAVVLLALVGYPLGNHLGFVTAQLRHPVGGRG